MSKNRGVTVPVQDSILNTESQHVVGNKTDTVAGDSVVALAKQVLALIASNPAVPTADVATNVDAYDVVGNKDDTVAGTSIVALVKQALEDFLVPSADSAANTDVADVVGNKDDVAALTGSIVAMCKKAASEATGAGTDTDALILLHAVPSQDSSDDVNLRDVVGKKDDTVAGTSIVALAKQVLALIASNPAVPAQDAAANTDAYDVIGNKTDSQAATGSLVAMGKEAAAKADTAATHATAAATDTDALLLQAGIPVSYEHTFAGGGGTADNLFVVHGTVECTIVGEVTTILSADVGNSYYALNDGTATLEITDDAGTDLSSAAVGSTIAKTDDASVVLTLLSSAAGAFNESANYDSPLKKFIVQQKASTATHIQLVYAGVGTSGVIKHQLVYKPITEGSYVEAV